MVVESQVAQGANLKQCGEIDEIPISERELPGPPRLRQRKYVTCPFTFTMVRSTIIVRASDALPLAASVDDEQVYYFLSFVSMLSSSHASPTSDRTILAGTQTAS